MSVATSLKKEIINRVSALPTVQKVYGYEKLNPEGFPAVFVILSAIENSFSSNAENRRIYVFNLMTIFPLGQSLETNPSDQNDQAESALSEVVDQIQNAIDDDYTLGGYDLALFVEAVSTEFGYVEYEGGWARTANLLVRVETDYTIN